jgi:hypothetical protein
VSVQHGQQGQHGQHESADGGPSPSRPARTTIAQREARMATDGGRPSFTLAYGLVLAGLAVCTAVGSIGRSIGNGFEFLAPASVWVDPAALAWPPSEELFDPRWAELLEQAAARHPPFSSRDGDALDRLREELAGLPFVDAIERLEVDENAGLVAELRFRRPVASIPVGTHFLLVDGDGVVLPGVWPAPVRVDGDPLPVVGPMSDAVGAFKGARAGDFLAEDAHLDALDIARSLREHLSREERVELGRVVIDASHARSSLPQDGGARLLLEGRRLIVFGRSPALLEPGELSAETKWRAVARALALLRGGASESDWGLVDVRWDEPEIALRNAPAETEQVALARPATAPARRFAPGPTRGSAPEPARRLARDDGKSRVR